MVMEEHSFTTTILNILTEHFGTVVTSEIVKQNQLIQYINLKTKSADRSSKSRGSFANLYAIYVLVEDYVQKQYHVTANYADYEGAQYNILLAKQRTLPFGAKLQNHALNHRLNEEFRKFFPLSTFVPIIRDVNTNRYWFNEFLLTITLQGQTYNLATAILEIITAYSAVKKESFEHFLTTCQQLQHIEHEQIDTVHQFIASLLTPDADARVFEIVSYAILKYYYATQAVYIGYSLETIEKETLQLFKTGRTNANDGGIDFVMKPLGRFFQVTETVDFKKYFLDIDKVEKYPLTFVIKSTDSIPAITEKIKQSATKMYSINRIVEKYLSCIEEIVNIPRLLDVFAALKNSGYLSLILEEIIQQSKIEFNYTDIFPTADDYSASQLES
jgi:hypothetical protein